jgi:hypothetical protein
MIFSPPPLAGEGWEGELAGHMRLFRVVTQLPPLYPPAHAEEGK